MSEKEPENLNNENLEPEDDDDKEDENATVLEEPEPELGPEDPVGILRKGREEMKNSEHIKGLREEMKMLKTEHTSLLIELKIDSGAEKKDMISRALDENEEKQKKIREEIQTVEDRIKKQMTNAAKNRRDEVQPQ